MKEVNWDKIEELIEEIAKEAEIDLDEAGSITILKDGHTQRIYIGVKVLFIHEKYGELSDIYTIESPT